MGAGRPQSPQARGAFSYSQEEATRLLGSYYAYYGTYEVDERAGTVRHLIASSLHPSEVGRTLERRFRIEDDQLTLETMPFVVEGKSVINRYVWRRIQPANIHP